MEAEELSGGMENFVLIASNLGINVLEMKPVSVSWSGD